VTPLDLALLEALASSVEPIRSQFLVVNRMEAPADDRANGLVRALARCLG
jgi:hypothetical protein